MNVDEFLMLVKSGSASRDGQGSERNRRADDSGVRKRARETDPDTIVKSGIMKRPNVDVSLLNTSGDPSKKQSVSLNSNVFKSSDIEISEEERRKILQMVEDEPEGIPFDDASLKRMVSVLDKKMAKNQEMRIKFPENPEKFMDSEVELHESIQELHALATDPDLYPVAVELLLPSTLLGLLAHENSDISCAVVDLLQELTDADTINENEEATSSFLDNLLEQQGISLLAQNLERLEESNKDEADGVYNTLAIFENLFEIRPQLCANAGQNGLLQWLLKRLRARIPFDANKLYVGEMLAILLQDTPENRAIIGDLDGIDILLQQLAAYKRHDPNSNEESEFMENLFNCLCSALLWGPNRDKFLKGEGPQLMNLMLREKKQARNGSLKVLNHAVSGPDGAANANKLVDILGLRTLFPLFMKTPKKAKRKGLSAREHEEHTISIISGLLQHLSSQNRNRVVAKFEENEFEKTERLCELHFKYLEKMNTVDKEILGEVENSGNQMDIDEIYMRRLDQGLFILQLLDFIILDVCVANSSVKQKMKSLIQLRRGSMQTIRDITKEYAQNIGDENADWKARQVEYIDGLLEQF